MSNLIDNHIINNLGEFVEIITKEIRRKEEGGKKSLLWFRGHKDMNWDLRPTLYRKIKNLDFWEDLFKKERMVIDEFRVRNFHLLEGRWPANDYMWLCLMQHYGTATRLLDWSELAFAGIFFAVQDYFKTDYQPTGRLPCVWIFQPLELINVLKSIKNNFNDLDCDNCKFCGDSLNNNSIQNLLNLHGEEKSVNQNDFVPIPVISPYNNERIRAQSGVFTLFPNKGKCIEKLGLNTSTFSLDKLPRANEFLQKIIICEPKHISDQLKISGYKQSLFYPEIPNVSIEIEEQYLRDLDMVAHS